MSEAKVLGEGSWTRLLVRNGWEFVTRTRGVMAAAIVAVTDTSELVLVEQHREPIGKATLELPAGLIGDIDAGEPAHVAAHRELLEETGFDAAHIVEVVRGPTSAGITDEQIVLYVATGLRRLHEGGGDATESIVVHTVPLDRAEEWLAGQVAAGKLVDLKVYTGLYFARRRPR